jgi:hypothetical protein
VLHQGARSAANSRVGPGERARRALHDAPDPRQLRERERAEVGRAEVGRVERHVRRAGRRLGDPLPVRVGHEAPAPGVPRAECVADLEHEHARPRVPSRRQRRPNVHDAKPGPVADREPQPPRLRQEQLERMGNRRPNGADGRDEIHAQEPAPQVPGRARCLGQDLGRDEGALRAPLIPVRLDPVDGRPLDLPAGLVDGEELDPIGATCLVRVVERHPVPPRLAARDHPGRLEGSPFARDLEAPAERREAVPEALVDGALRGPQDRERLAARVDVVQLVAHHRAQDAAPAIGGVDADERHARRGCLPARHAQAEAEGACRRHRPLAVERRDDPIRLPRAALLVAGVFDEGKRGEERCRERFDGLRCRRPDGVRAGLPCRVGHASILPSGPA